MRINIFCSCSIDETIKGTAAIGIILEAKEGRQVVKKRLSYFLGKSDKNHAYATAIKCGLSAITNKFKSTATVINVDDEHVADMLTLSDVSEKEDQIPTMLEMRRLVSSFEDVSIVLDDGVSDNIIEAKLLAKKSKEMQKNLEMSSERNEID